MYNSGSPGAKTGSPLDGATCAQCHNSTVSSAEWISTNIPESGYVPGQKYVISLNVSDATAVKIGFELTAESTVGKQGAFSITDDARTKLTNVNKSVTHKSAGVAPVDGKISWNVEWTAPISGTGDITFYAAINGANGNNSTSGDKIYTSKHTVKEATKNAVTHLKTPNISVYPNPAHGFFFVESQVDIESITVFDISGKAITQLDKIGESKTQVNLDNYKPGLYIVKTKTKEGEKAHKIQLF